MYSETDSDYEPHFFDALKQAVYAGDVCLVIGQAKNNFERYETLVPVLITAIDRMKMEGHFAYCVTFKVSDSECEYKVFIMKGDAYSSDQFVLIKNPEFFSDSEQMAKILVMQYDLKNSLKR